LRALLDDSVRHGRKHFRQAFPGVAVPFALASGAMSLAQGLLMAQAESRSLGTPFYLSIALLVASALGYLVVYSLGSAALVAAAVDAIAGRAVSMRRSWRAMLRPRALGTLAALWLAFALGLMCCLLPGLYAAIVFGLSVPVMLEEGVFGIGALKRSSALMSRNPRREIGDDPRLKLLVLVLVGWLIGTALSVVVQVPMIVTQQVLIFRSVTAGEHPNPAALTRQLLWLQVPSAMVASLAQMATNLYVAFGAALLFFDIKARQEGADLEQTLAELEGRGALGEPVGP
jgi:hypothetical protein